MSDISDRFDAAVIALREAEDAYATAESNLIKARREKRDAERAYYREMFPTPSALHDYFS